jgi:hypothetical protein
MCARSTLASVSHDSRWKGTSRERFLGAIDRVFRWPLLLAVMWPRFTPQGRCHRALLIKTIPATEVRSLGSQGRTPAVLQLDDVVL